MVLLHVAVPKHSPFLGKVCTKVGFGHMQILDTKKGPGIFLDFTDIKRFQKILESVLQQCNFAITTYQ